MKKLAVYVVYNDDEMNNYMEELYKGANVPMERTLVKDTNGKGYFYEYTFTEEEKVQIGNYIKERDSKETA